ncbi:hypothetical protein AB0E01_41330 [Nocardia vinacea]|uniref:hypothetical protein n=1 Tax=Nocardia vinacea TaxID=96468 RepID=UPI0033F97541
MSVRHSKCADVHRDGDGGPGSQELLFEHVRVEGIPTRGEHLRVFLETQTCRHLLGRLDAAWPMPVLEDRDTARSGRPHRAARTLLGRILEYGERLSATDNTLRRSGLTVPKLGEFG